jgi:hypothetical protein
LFVAIISQITPAVRRRDVADIPLFYRCYLAAFPLLFAGVFQGKKQ